MILVLVAGLCTPALAVYAETEAVQEEPKSFTEGADTAVTISSYTDFDEESACFPKEGDIVAKTRLAAEELYKLSKGKASSES